MTVSSRRATVKSVAPLARLHRASELSLPLGAHILFSVEKLLPKTRGGPHMAGVWCPYCDLMLKGKEVAKKRCGSCGKALPHCPSCDDPLTKEDLKERECGACEKKLPLCPTCDVLLTKKDLADGWCDACGKKLPLFLTTPAREPRPAPYAPATSRPPDSKLYRFARKLDRVCLAILLFVFASCLGVPALFLLFSSLEWPFDSSWTLQRLITTVQFVLILVLVAVMLIAKGLKVFCGTDGS
jgi:hypothetical protein